MYHKSRVSLFCSAAIGSVMLVPSVATAEVANAGSSPSVTIATAQTDAVKTSKKAKKARRTKAEKKLATRKATRERRQAQADAADTQGDITVIGSMISGNVTENAPVQTIDQEYIEDHGYGRLEDTMGQLPGIVPGLGLRGSEGSTRGPNGIDLRGLGSDRTLVLVNGQRAPNDLNAIPAALLERADILTGGASATYGSDAIAGVVNFKLKRKFNGIRFDGEVSAVQHRNDNRILLDALAAGKYPTPVRNFFGGAQSNVTLTAGKSILNDRVNISGSVTYKKTYPIMYKDYDTGGCPLLYNDPAKPAEYRTNSGYYCRLNEYNPRGYFVIITNLNPQRANAYSVTPDGSGFNLYDAANETIRNPMEGYLQREDESVIANMFVSADLFKDVKLDASLFFSKYDTIGQEKVNGNYYTQGAFPNFNLVNCDNPFLSAGQASFLLCGANAGQPGKFASLVATTLFRDAFVQERYYHAREWRGSVNMSGTLIDQIRFRASYQRTNTDRNFGSDNEYNYNLGFTRVARALQVRNVNGVPTCISKIDGTDPNCVPANIFTQGGLDPKFWEYVTTEGRAVSNSTQQVAILNLSGSLAPYGIKSPFATAGVGFALVGEWRRDTATSQGFGSYALWTSFNGIINVKEVAGELNVPLIQDKPLIKDLTVNGGFRLSDYSSYSKLINSWKADMTYSPFDGLRFRASYSRAIRVPVKERLEAENRYPNRSYLDLCAPPRASDTQAGAKRYTFEQCARGGMTRQQYDALTSYVGCDLNGYCPTTLINGGNPALLPERSRSITAGVVARPGFLRGFTASADFYDINIFRSVTYARIGNAFEYCYDKAVQLFCDMYQRDATTGVLLAADARYVNSGITRNRGIDINLNQNIDTDWRVFGKPVGGFTINVVGNRILKQVTQFGPGAPDFGCMGLFGFSCGVVPVWRNNVNVAWRIPGKSAPRLSFTWRHNAGTKAAYLSSNPLQQLTPNASDSAKFPLLTRLPAADYLDAAFKMDLSKSVSIRLNVQNLLDRDPPIAAQGTFGTGASGVFNTYPGYYEILGRTIRFGISMRQ